MTHLYSSRPRSHVNYCLAPFGRAPYSSFTRSNNAQIYVIIAEQPYPTLRFAWLLGQWSLLCISLAVLARVNTTPQRAALLFSVALLAIASNPAWRLHVERGQLYII